MRATARRFEPAQMGRLYTEAELKVERETAFRAGYGAGADAMQLERRHRPFLIEDEAVAEWREARP